ncbi:hypothetical protein EHS25_008455 [Saitozyma podzolica]|uniref:Uncharacterized protein n=1 Tax=Saitozyma podzolica TaxID=1890683 RepID=A0A427YPK8_9TREE|nr:hypothetical protein EHS25_008455 [Saitozyma podzolica]
MARREQDRDIAPMNGKRGPVSLRSRCSALEIEEAYASPSLRWKKLVALALLATTFLLLANNDCLRLHRPTAFLRPTNQPGVPSRGKALTPSNYTVVRGFFVQSEPDFNATDYDVLSDSFGLMDKSPNRWVTFSRHVDSLNEQSDRHTSYKVLFLARHGEGYHNVAERLYGTSAWNCHWSKRHSDGDMTWASLSLANPSASAKLSDCS